MTSEATPVMFRASSRTRLIAVAIGLFLVVMGILMISDSSGSLLGYGLSPRVRSSMAGWFVLGLGVIVTVAGLLGVMRGCPVLELRDDGIFYTRCLQGLTHVPWSDFDHIVVEKSSVPSLSGSDINLEGIVVVTTSGRRVGIHPIAPLADMESGIARAAAKFKPKTTAA